MRPDPSITELIARALEVPAGERAAFLDAACGDRAALRAEVDSLLAVADASGDRLATPMARIQVDEADDEPVDAPAPGTRLGRYVIEGELGAGGMGTVHRARQVEPIERPVAIKLVKPGMDTRAVLARFDLERRTLARLAHPNVATLLDAGRTPAGRPFVVMELVDGEPLTRFARRHALDVPARIDLLLEACAGVRHAHRRGVLHRDLKSSNVLVAKVDGRPLVKVIDFGIARLLEADPGTTDAEMTRVTGGRSPGTPRSMAPEQHEPGGVPDVRTDVYALGVLLVDLLGANGPVDPAAEDAPAADPLAAIDEVAPGDLRWVARRCLEAQPDDRYDGVDALMADLERWRRHEPTLAGPPSLARRVRVAWRRHRVPVSVAAVVVAALGTGLGVALDAREAARTDARRATVANAFLADLFDRLDPEIARTQDTALLRAMLDDAASRVEDELRGEPAAEAVGRAVVGRGYAVIGEARLAEPHLRRAIELESRPEQRRELRTRLVSALKDLGELDEAAMIAEDVLEGLRRDLGPDDMTTLTAANNLATVFMRQRRHEEAEPLLRAVLAGKLQDPDAEAASISLIRSNLATTLAALGREEEALPMREAVLAETEATMGPDSPRTFAALNNLAGSLERVGTDPDRAIALRERALSLALSLHEDRHPNALVARNNLAMLLASRDRHAEAEPVFQAALAIMVDAIGEDHFFTVATRKNLAETLVALGRAEEAIPIAAAAEASAFVALDEGHPLRGLAVLAHADALHAVGRTADAREVLRRGEERLGPAGVGAGDWATEAATRRAAWADAP